MSYMKDKFFFALKSMQKDFSLKPILNDLNGKSYVISGGTRGIGFNIAKTLALSGANVTLLGKTVSKHPKLENTIHSAAELITNATGKQNCTGVACDIRNSKQIENAVNTAIDLYGNLDGVILNASALCLNNTENQTEKEIELMSSVNINGTYITGQKCLKYIKKSDHPNVIVIAPPISMLYNDNWWTNNLYYSMSKFNMSLMAKIWDKEFPNVSVNTLWPRTTIDTAPVRNILGGSDMVNISRTPDIMGLAAKSIIMADPKICTGNNYIDDYVLGSLDIDPEQFRVNKNISEKDLMPDFFC